MKNETDHHHVPVDIILNILSKCSIKFLCRSKCLSKQYLSLIQHPFFIHKTLPKITPQFTSPILETGAKVVDIYSIDEDNQLPLIDVYNQVSFTLYTYKAPPGTFYLKRYKGFICSFKQAPSQVTLFNTITQDSITVSFPKSASRYFECGFDPCSRKYKVLSYQYGYRQGPKNFEILTLGEEESSTWRTVNNNIPLVNKLPDWVTIVDGRIFWFDYKQQLISFSFTKEELMRIDVPDEKRTFLQCGYDPLVEFDGSLCLVERPNCTGMQWEFNWWILNDIDNGFWMIMKRISLPRSGTNFPAGNCVTFFAQNGELFISSHDYLSNYIFSCNFLNGECKRMKIV